MIVLTGQGRAIGFAAYIIAAIVFNVAALVKEHVPEWVSVLSLWAATVALYVALVLLGGGTLAWRIWDWVRLFLAMLPLTLMICATVLGWDRY